MVGLSNRNTVNIVEVDVMISTFSLTFATLSENENKLKLERMYLLSSTKQ